MRLFGAGALIDEMTERVAMMRAGDGYAVGSHLDYSLDQEYGNSHQAGTPHMRPGIDATRQHMARLALQADNLDEYLQLVSLRLVNEVQTRAPVDTGALRASYSPPVPLDESDRVQ